MERQDADNHLQWHRNHKCGEAEPSINTPATFKCQISELNRDSGLLQVFRVVLVVRQMPKPQKA